MLICASMTLLCEHVNNIASNAGPRPYMVRINLSLIEGKILKEAAFKGIFQFNALLCKFRRIDTRPSAASYR